MTHELSVKEKVFATLLFYILMLAICFIAEDLIGGHEIYTVGPLTEELYKFLMSSVFGLPYGLLLGVTEFLGYVLGGTAISLRIGGLVFHSITAVVYAKTGDPKDIFVFLGLHMLNNLPCGLYKTVELSFKTRIWLDMNADSLVTCFYVWKVVEILFCSYILWKKVIRKSQGN